MGVKMQNVERAKQSLRKLDEKAEKEVMVGALSAATLTSYMADELRQDITEYYREFFAPMYDYEHYIGTDIIPADIDNSAA
jgi:hypothetical protein